MFPELQLYFPTMFPDLQLRFLVSRERPPKYFMISRSFWDLLVALSCMPVLEYFSAVWCSAAESHLWQLDRVIKSAEFLAGGGLECQLAIDYL